MFVTLKLMFTVCSAGLTIGEVVAICVGVIVTVFLIIAVIVACYHRKAIVDFLHNPRAPKNKVMYNAY